MRHPLPLTAALACLLAACGQTGPLYLPDEGVTTPVEIRTAPVQPAGPAAPAAQEPAEPKKEDGPNAPPPDAGT
jgi:predicted small lipoprotein YifL